MVDITPQIGVNATNGDGGQEIFTLPDAQKVERFAAQQGLGRLGFWAIGRDQNPNNNQGDLSEIDSGVTQNPYDFSKIFNQFGGNVQPPAIPPAPDGVAANAGDAQVIVTWNTVPGATSYNVYRGTASGQEQWLTNVTRNSFTDVGVADGTTYYYKITAGNNSGGSVFSFEVSATPQVLGVPPPPVAVTATLRNGQVNLTWFYENGATSYNVYRSTTSGQEQWLTNVTDNSFIDTNVQPGTTYYYTVTAGNDSGESAFSVEVAVTVV
jgi:fibronectin type 3 domain-containing protein